MMGKILSAIWLGTAIAFSIGGLAFFVLLFGRQINVFWIIVLPIIFAVYQIPAAVVLWLWRRKYRSSRPGPSEEGDSGSDEREMDPTADTSEPPAK
jgi:hypothetical protein